VSPCRRGASPEPKKLSLILRSGDGVYHRAALRADPLAASRRMKAKGLMVRDAQDALLTMRHF
jgi:hypothetical protein